MKCAFVNRISIIREALKISPLRICDTYTILYVIIIYKFNSLKIVLSQCSIQGSSDRFNSERPSILHDPGNQLGLLTHRSVRFRPRIPDSIALFSNCFSLESQPSWSINLWLSERFSSDIFIQLDSVSAHRNKLISNNQSSLI